MNSEMNANIGRHVRINWPNDQSHGVVAPIVAVRDAYYLVCLPGFTYVHFAPDKLMFVRQVTQWVDDV